MEIIRKIRSSMAVSIIGSIIILLLIFGVVVSSIGFVSFTNAFKREYDTSTFHLADTATTLVNGDNITSYLAGENMEEYSKTQGYLDVYCMRMNVSLVYVISVDQSDYGRFVSIFNSVNNSVDNSNYVPWDLGYKRDTTNDEYRKKYRNLYENNSQYETVYRTKPTDGSHAHITTMVPIRNAEGAVSAILCVQRPIRELRTARLPYLINIALSTVGLGILSAIAATAYLRKQFVQPISTVSEEASRFARENTKGESIGSISKYDEIANLAKSIDKMESDMVSYIENLTAITAEKERIGAELSFASTIQEKSIPNVFPAFPERSDFDIHASMTPAKEVGGDFYNFFLIDDDHLAFIIGDVSGKGVPAALFMMVTNIVINDRARMGGTPGEILTFANNSICEHNEANMFVTVWMGILEISTGKIIAANAGHCDAAVLHGEDGFEIHKAKHGMAIGMMPDYHYTDFEFQLNKGDKVFLYTDGVSEATDPDNNLFTVSRLQETLNTLKDQTPQQILEGVHKRVKEFEGPNAQFDDLTMLCLELK